ncbi:MAG: sugar isomerase domain-containing protein [Actinomycetota bacterium]
MSARNHFGEDMRAHLALVEQVNDEMLDRVADLMFDVITSDGLVYVGGTGHSISLMLESFYRAGGLACVQPLYNPGLLPLHGGEDSTLAEKTSGFAHLLVERFAPTTHDIAFVFSNSGVNAVPVELADELHARGTPVVAVVSLTHLRAAPARAAHKIDTVADFIIDTMVPYGDAVYPAGEGTKTAGLSSLTGIYVWNLLLSRIADRAEQKGVRLPIFTSSNVEGGHERNAELFKHYRTKVHTL